MYECCSGSTAPLILFWPVTSEVNVEGMTHCSSVSALVTAHVKHVLMLVEISGERAACDLLGFF